MKTKYRIWIVTCIIVMLIGNTAVEAAGFGVLQSKLSSNDAQEMLTSVSVFAGSGDYADRDGAVLEASFRMPQGIAVLEDGSVLVADSKNHLIRQIKNGQVSTYAGFMLHEGADGTPSGGWHDDARQSAVFDSPVGLATDSEGHVYIADQDNHVIRKISKDGTVSTIAGDGILGHEDGTGTKTRFYQPQDVAVAKDGTLYVADTLNHVLRRITPDGQVTTLNAPSDRVVEVMPGYAVPAGDYADGKLSTAKFNEPTSLAIDRIGNLYVSDTGNHVIRYIDLAEGTVSTVAGLPVLAEGALYGEGGYLDGAASEARFYSPRGIAITEEQGLVIADSLNHVIRYLVNGQVSTIAGVPAQFGHVDGINGHNLLHHPSDVAVLPDGNLLIADSYNNKVRQLDFYELPSHLPQNDQVKVVLENEIIGFDAQPEIVKGRTMVPVRALSEQLGYEVVFDDNEQTIKLAKGDVTIAMQVGSRVITIENVATDAQDQMKTEVAPYKKAGRTYVPVKFFSEAFGVDVAWDKKTKTVILRGIVEPVDKLSIADRHSRGAVLEQIKGTVWINQAGGSLTYRAYNGTRLHHGAHITTESNSSTVLRTVDRKDEISIGENSKLYLSNLSSASHVKHTSFVLWNGLVGASVSSLIDSQDTFKMITPTAVTDVRGTHFMIGIDPITGNPSIFVSSGLVQTRGNETSQNPVVVYPAQQINLTPGREPNVPRTPYMMDPSDVVKHASPAVLEALLKQKQRIDQENEEMLERLKNGTFSDPNGTGGDSSQNDLDQLQRNLDNLIAIIAREARDQQKIDPDRLQRILDEANSGDKIDLDNVPPLQLTEQQRRQQEREQKYEEEVSKRQEEQKKRQEEEERRLAATLERIQAEKERLEQENRRRMEEARQKAEESLRQSLPDTDRERFDQRKEQLEQQRRQQEAAQRQPVTPPTRPTPPPTEPTPTEPTPPPTNHAPKVINPIPDRLVNSEEPLEIDVSDVFSDEDGDTLTYTVHLSNSDIVRAEVEGALLYIRPSGMGSTTITITATDGNGGKAEVSFLFGLYAAIPDLRAEVSTDFIYLIWDYYGDHEEGELTYYVYMDGEQFNEPTNSSAMQLSELTPDTAYMLRVVAVNHAEEMVAFADLEVSTLPVDW